MGTHPIFESDFDCLTEMIIYKIATKIKNDNHGIVLREFDSMKFTIFTYFCFGTFFMVLLRKICDLQDQIHFIELERDFLLNEIPTPDSKYLDEPEEFINVKDVPAIFTINKHNFTEHNLQECNCTQLSIEGKLAKSGI